MNRYDNKPTAMIRLFKEIRKKLLSEGKFVKYIQYALGEIILVVIGILIALKINTMNNERITKNRVDSYAQALIQDMKSDIEMIDISQFQAKKNVNNIIKLRTYFSSTKLTDLSNTDLYILTHDILYRPYKWNRSTLVEMKNAEILPYFKNSDLKNKLIEYETFTFHLDEDFDGDQSNAIRAEEISTEILNLNSSYFTEMKLLETVRFNDPDLNLFDTDIYKNSRANDFALVSYEEKDLRKFLNTFIQIQDHYQIRAFHEMEDIKENANQIIKLLESEMAQ